MKYKISSKDNIARLWTYYYFIDESHSKLLSYETDGNLILSVTLFSDNPIPESLFVEYEFNFQILPDH